MNFTEIFKNHNLPSRNLLCYSKSEYIRENQGHNIIFNCSIYTLEDGCIWKGDIDITKSLKDLLSISTIIKKKLYCVKEYNSNLIRNNQDIPNVASFIIPPFNQN